jgi:hypothetical protein
MERRFWVFEWLEDNHITSVSEAAEFLPKYKVIQSLRQRAEENQENPPNTDRENPSVVAGTGIDLTGGHSVCPSPTCMRAQVDELFSRIWHYFESIIVRDTFTPLLLQDPAERPEDLIEMLLIHLPPLLYLREIGAEDLVEFVPKTPCVEHWKEHAEEQGLAEVLRLEDSMSEEIRKGATFFARDNTPGDLTYWMRSPELDTTAGLSFKNRPEINEQERQQLLVQQILRRYIVDLTADLATAHELKLPLGAARGMHGRMLAAARPTRVSDVIFQIDLPILDGLSTKNLIEIRRKEHDSFVQFRNSLRVAVAERIKLSDGEAAQSIAEQVRLDYIEPALHRIRQRLVASERALAKKSGVAMFLGALGTTCGVLCGVPPEAAVPAGAMAAIAVTGVAAQKHIEEKQQVSLDDMYFLWKATEHSH